MSGVLLGVTALPARPAAAVGSVTVAGDATGQTDATVAFTGALNQLSAAGGGTLVVPPGKYLVRPDVVNVSSNTTVSGTGATLLASGDGYSLLGVSGSAIEVDGLTVDGASHVLHVVEIGQGTTNLTFRGVTVQNAGQPAAPSDPNYSGTVAGIRVEGDGHTMLFDSINVHNITAIHPDSTPSLVARGLLLDNGGANATTVSKGVTVQNSTFSEVGPKDDGDCLVLQNSSDTDAALVITNNTFDRCHKRAIKLQVGGATIQHNTVNNPFLGDNAYQVRQETLINGKPSFDMFSAVGLFSSNMTVSDNTFGGVGSFYQGIEIAEATNVGPLQNLTIQRNTISNGPNSQTGAPSSLIRSSDAISGLNVIGNKLTNAPYGLFFEQPLTTPTITCDTYVSVTTVSANTNASELACEGLDQYQTATSGAASAGVSAVAVPAQTFQAGVSGPLTRVSVYAALGAVCPTVTDPFNCPTVGPGDLVAQIRSVDATGAPTDTVLSSASVPLASGPLASAPLGKWTWVDLSFASPAQVTAGTMYALVLTSTSRSGDYLWGLLSTGDPSVPSTAYPNGEAAFKTSGGWQLEASQDLAFKTYVGTAAGAPINNPLPTLSAVSPTSAQKGSAGLTVTVTGTNFVADSVVRWNGADLVTRPDPSTPSTRLSASVPATDVATLSTSEVTVFSPAPGGGTSTPLDFFVTDTATTVDASATLSGFASPQLSAPNATGGTTSLTLTPSPGNGTLTLAHYAADPVATAAPLPSANYYDIHVSPGSTYTSLSLLICNGGNLVYWWDTSTNSWLLASPQQPDPTQPGCVDVTLTPQSSPSMTQLTGTPFAIVSDTTPPTTTAEPAPAAVVAGQPLVKVTASANVQSTSGTLVGTIDPIQCWNSQGVVVTLTAKDSGAGVKQLTYAATGAQPLPSTSVGGSSVALPSLSATGLTTLTYAAQDKVGNQEATKRLSVLVASADNGKAVLACAAPGPTFSLPTHGRLVLSGTATINGLTAPFKQTVQF